MSEHDPDVVRDVLIAAMAAAGPKGNNEAAWKGKINEAIPHVVSMLNPSSRQWRIAEEVMGAQVFTAVYRGYHVEESSTRCVVTLETTPSKRYPDGLEPIRSHRTDNAQGKSMKARLDHLEDGDTLLVWKAMEAAGEDTKVRVLVHFERLPHRTGQERSQRESVPSGEQRGTDRAEEPQAPEPARLPADDYTDEIDSERIVGWRHVTLERLTEAQADRLKKELGKKGYDFYGVSEIEWVNVVRPLIREIIE